MFVFFEKFLDFDEDIIHDILKKIDMYQNRLSMTKEQLKAEKKQKEAKDVGDNIINILGGKRKDNTFV